MPAGSSIRRVPGYFFAQEITRRGGAGPSPPLYSPDFSPIRLPKFFGIKNRFPSLGRVLINRLSVSARLSRCPLRSESDQSAALPRIDGMCREETFSSNETLWNIDQLWLHSGLILAARTTCPHFSVSPTMSLPKSAGEPTSTVAPTSESLVLIFGSTRAALISLLSLSTIAGGVFLGAPTPRKLLAS